MEREEKRENGKEGRRGGRGGEGRTGRRKEAERRKREITGRERRRKEGGRQLLPGRREGGFWPHTAHSSPSSLERYRTCIYFLSIQVGTWLAE